MYAGDEHTHWNDTGPCPDCGDPDCWLGCHPHHHDDSNRDEVES